MLNVGLKSALSIWLDLDDAYHGKNGYGGTVAEIYAYRLMPSSPSGKADVPQAAKDLVSMIELFEEVRGCRILVDEIRPRQWLETGVTSFGHRVHVKVMR